MKELAIIQSLWIGDRLSTMERLCISSFLYHGHPFYLYTYGHVENIPKGTVIKDANEIVPSDMIFKYKDYNSYAGFSNLFRYKLLYEKGGYWVDTDIICLKPFLIHDKYIFASQRSKTAYQNDNKQANNCLMKVPIKSEIMKYCYEIALSKDNTKIKWGETGPELLTMAIEKFNFSEYLANPEEYCPIDWWEWEKFIDGSISKSTLSKGKSVHLWHEMWRRNELDKDTEFNRNSIYEWLKKKYIEASPVSKDTPLDVTPLSSTKVEKSSRKIFFLIPTCEKYSHKADALRNTWVKQLHRLGFNYLFIIGKPETKQAKVIDDILYVPCKDDYESLLLKLTLGYEYIYKHFEFTYVHKIDDDCFLDIEKFKANIYPHIHTKKYFGCKVNRKGSKLDPRWHFGKCTHQNFEKAFPQNKIIYDYAAGFGYLLHIEILPKIIAHKEEFKKELETYVYSYEDLRIGEILNHHQIFPIRLKNYSFVPASDYIGSPRNLVYDIEDPQLMFKIERDLEDHRLPTPVNPIDSSIVSIIVTAFNVEENISRCLDSIINQTYQNIEVIVVNDASTDNTRNVVEKYIQKDQRITCIDKENNAGCLQARMTGIKKARGAYIYSVNSEDYIMPDLVKDTLEEALRHDADIVQFPMKFSEENSKYTENWTIREYQEYTNNNFFIYNENSWTIMFKKELGDNLRKYIGSLSVNYHEGYIISFILSAFYKKVRYIDTAYYVYCDTGMTKQYNDEAILKLILDTLTFAKFIKELNPIIFPKEKSEYSHTMLSNRIGHMQNQLNLYFKESKKVSIYNLYNNTDKNKTFILNSMLYETIQIKNAQLRQKQSKIKQQQSKIKQQQSKIKQQQSKIKQQQSKIKQQQSKIKQQQSKMNTLIDNRWYRFGQMSKKKKIWTIGKVVSKKVKLYWVLQPLVKSINKILGN